MKANLVHKRGLPFNFLETLMAMGRPRKEFEQKQFEKLCGLHCTEEEIAGWFEMGVDTLVLRIKEVYAGKTFQEIYKMYSASGKVSLRRTQFKMAKTSPAMAIWLGKQYLGQKEKYEVDMGEAFKGKIEVCPEYNPLLKSRIKEFVN